MIKIIFSDMDGTLLDENGNLPNGFDEMIAKLKERDVIFAPASGRQYFSLLRTFEKYKDDFLFLAENGALVMYQGEEIFVSSLDPRKADEVRAITRNLPNILRVFCGKKNAYILKSQNTPEYIAELNKYYTRHKCVDSFEEIDDVPLKLAYFDITGNSEETIYRHIKHFNGPLQVVKSSDNWVDVMNPVINKGVAVQEVQEGLAITPDNCAAFGDYLNDVQMLQAVTYSFAMANSHPDLKKFANYETVSNSEHGVLVGIERLMNEGLI